MPRSPTRAVGSALLRALPPKHFLRHIVAPEIGRAEVAEGDLGGFVPCLAHQLGQARPGVAGGGGEPGAQRVPGIALRVEPGVQRGLFDQAGNGLVRQAAPVSRPVLVTAQNSGRSARMDGGGGPVEVGGGAAMRQPGVQRRSRAEARLGRGWPRRRCPGPGRAGRSWSGAPGVAARGRGRSRRRRG